MWCFQKPGFEDLLLTELQKQQQCNRFCDTLLTAGGLSVPAHSCILSAISPHISSSFSSKPPPHGGQSHRLEFPDLSLSTLLRIVGLVYSGEMAGEGEKEKQEAVSAAAKLGIHGLVEVTKKDNRGKTREEVNSFEVGVQTESEILEVMHGRGWRREVRNGNVLLWKETLSNGGNDMQTQTEELEVNSAPPPQPLASFETIDMNALQSLGQTESHCVPQIIPITFVYPPNENQACQPSSTPAASVLESAAATTPAPQILHHFSGQMTPAASDHPNCWANHQGAVAGEHIEQFQNNISGFINSFLSPGQEEGIHRGRAGRRQGARVSGTRRGRTGERRARRPRGPSARMGGMGREALTQMVDVQEVTVVKLQKLFQHRYGMRVNRTSQGGGAVGRKLYLKTRELLNPARGRQRRGHSKVWELSQSGDLLLCSQGRGGSSQRRKRDAAEQQQQDTIQRPPTSNLSSPAACCMSAASLLHTALLPPPPPPPHEDQPEHIDRLLEEVMLRLDILPSSNVPAHSQHPLPTDGTEVIVERGAGSSSTVNGGAPVIQQQSDGELTEMLDHFLQSFEKHVGSCNAREEREMPQSSAEAGQPDTVQRTSKIRNSQTPHTQNTESKVECSQTTKQQRCVINHTVSPKHTEGTPEKRKKRRRSKQYMFSLEKKKVKVKKLVSSGDTKNKHVLDQMDKQLQQRPVVKLKRRDVLPVERILQGHSWQSLHNKSPVETSSNEKLESVKSSSNDVSEKKTFLSTKTYPIRSRFKKALMLQDSGAFLQQPHSADQRALLKRKRQPHCSINNERSLRLVEELQKNQDRHEEESNGEPQDIRAEPLNEGQRRGAESCEDAPVSKRPCPEPVQEQPVQGSCKPKSVDSSTMKQEEIINEEPVLMSTEYLQRNESKGNPVCCESIDTQEGSAAEDTQSRSDDTVDVEGDDVDTDSLEREGAETDHSQTGTAQSPSHCGVDNKPSVPSLLSGFSADSTQSCEEDEEEIDVIGGSSPAPDPIIISWIDSDTGEEEADEDVDIDGEEDRLNFISGFTAVSNTEHA